MNFFRISIVVILFIGGSILLGLSLNYNPKFDLNTQVKRNVADILEYPSSANFKDITYYFLRDTSDGGTIGYVCGTVFRFNANHLPEGYKRFILKAYQNPNGRNELSIPMIEGDEDVLLSEKVDILWQRYCK